MKLLGDDVQHLIQRERGPLDSRACLVERAHHLLRAHPLADVPQDELHADALLLGITIEGNCRALYPAFLTCAVHDAHRRGLSLRVKPHIRQQGAHAFAVLAVKELEHIHIAVRITELAGGISNQTHAVTGHVDNPALGIEDEDQLLKVAQ